MVFLLVGAIVLSFFWFLVGRAFFTAIRARAESIDFELTLLVGGFVAAVAAQTVHFFVPLLSVPSSLAVAGTFAVLLFWRFADLRAVLRSIARTWRQHSGLSVTFVAVATGVAFSAARPCKIEDTVNYHAQVLRWTEASSLVPGLALVHGRLGFNSLWFPLESIVSFAFLGRGPLPLANTTTFLAGLLFLLRQIFPPVRSDLRASLALAATLPYVAAGFLYAGSQSPDLPALTYGLLAFVAVADAMTSRTDEHYLVALCLAVAAACWKLSAAPLGLFVVILLWDRFVRAAGRFDRSWGLALAFLATAGLVTMARSVVLSGYPFFPSTAFDLFPVSWKAPSLAHGQQVWVRAFARGFHQNPAAAMAAPLAAWIPQWIANLNSVARLVMVMVAAGLLLAVPSLFFRTTRRWLVENDRAVLAALAVVAITSSVFWFFEAPDVRFGASYLIALLSIGFLPWTWALRSLPRLRAIICGAVLTAAGGVVIENLIVASPVPPWANADYAAAYSQRLHWLIPAPYPEARFVDEHLRDGSLNHVVADGGLAFYGPVPNSPLPIAGIAVRRGLRLSDGYRVDDGR